MELSICYYYWKWRILVQYDLKLKKKKKYNYYYLYNYLTATALNILSRYSFVLIKKIKSYAATFLKTKITLFIKNKVSNW